MNSSPACQEISSFMQHCTLCPRRCGVNRTKGQTGYCGQTDHIKAARASLHLWEEPCISGRTGSGTVFFSGCNLQCVYCQNRPIALGQAGKELTVERLADIFLELQGKNANNINLVTAAHFVPQVCKALRLSKEKGLRIPIVYNSGGYESVSALRLLEGLVDIYLPDFKYVSSDLSLRYSHAADYFDKASEALAEMYRQVGEPVFHPKSGIMTRGIIVRHLVLPGCAGDSKRVLRYLHNTYGDHIYISIMSQYTPLPQMTDYPELNRKVTEEEYGRVLRFAQEIGIEKGFLQEGEAASESFIPAFDGEGL